MSEPSIGKTPFFICSFALNECPLAFAPRYADLATFLGEVRESLDLALHPEFASMSKHERGQHSRDASVKRILRNAGSLLLSGAVGEVLTTYAIGLTALTLGPAGFGKLSEAQAFMDPFETLPASD